MAGKDQHQTGRCDMNDRSTLLRAALEASPERARAALAVLRGEEKQTAAPPQGLLGVKAAADYLGGLSRTSLWRLRRSGILRGITVGKGRRCFRIKDLDEAIDKMAEEGE